jgi:hypothetical protein
MEYDFYAKIFTILVSLVALIVSIKAYRLASRFKVDIFLNWKEFILEVDVLNRDNFPLDVYEIRVERLGLRGWRGLDDSKLNIQMPPFQNIIKIPPNNFYHSTPSSWWCTKEVRFFTIMRVAIYSNRGNFFHYPVLKLNLEAREQNNFG